MSCVKTSPPGCATSICPDPCACPNFQIKRGDTRPPFKVSVQDENGPINFTGLVIEVNMWIETKLKSNITEMDASLALAGNVGFEQILPNDIILMNKARTPEQMRILGFDETQNLIFVERGYNNTVPQNWKKNTPMQIFRIINGPAQSEMVFDDVPQVDGTTLCNQLIESFLVYEWNANDTCVSGCFFFEFKVLKMSADIVVPSVTPLCFSGVGVEWVRRFPTCDAFVIKICDTPTSESFVPPSTT
jgi:hypothetical protein